MQVPLSDWKGWTVSPPWTHNSCQFSPCRFGADSPTFRQRFHLRFWFCSHKWFKGGGFEREAMASWMGWSHQQIAVPIQCHYLFGVNAKLSAGTNCIFRKKAWSSWLDWRCWSLAEEHLYGNWSQSSFRSKTLWQRYKGLFMRCYRFMEIVFMKFRNLITADLGTEWLHFNLDLNKWINHPAQCWN